MHLSRKKQVVICGFSRSGSTLLYNMFRYAAPDVLAPERESSAMALLAEDAAAVLTKRPLDVFRIAELRRVNAERKDLRLVITVRDPRSLVSSIHERAPMQWFQGFDHSFLVAPDGLSFCNPGVLSMHRASSDACRSGLPTIVCRYEELVADPKRVQTRLAEFTGFDMRHEFAEFHSSPIPEQLQPQLNGVRSIDQNRLFPWAADTAVAERVVRQFRLSPQLFDVMEAWGYERNRNWFDELSMRVPGASQDKRGTIVSFFTQGTRYEREAARLERSAKRLGLAIDMSAVPDRGTWLKNVRFKGRFLREKRKQLRGPLLWVDADAVLHADPWPYLSGYEADIAVATHSDGRLISATLWMDDTKGCQTALGRWYKEMAADGAVNDQVALERIANQTRTDWPNAPYRFQYLPPSFCYVFDRTKKQFPDVIPIIEQLQASREIRLEGEANQANLARRRARVAELDQEFHADYTASSIGIPK
jgi:hypothetical protein